MDQQKPRGPAQPNEVDQAEDQKRQTGKHPQSKAEKKSDDQPGADGFRSARADEDTYD